jgi:phosphoglycolate phosphatase-like HAD superfamily hydrolase
MPKTPTKLLLFDIDGTLVKMQKGMPHDIFESAMREIFGFEINLDGFDFSGKTDYLIFREVGKIAGLSDEEIAINQEQVMDFVANSLEETMNGETLALLPGVRELLESLDREERAILAILTGNTPRGAHVKLKVHDLNRFFRFGVYGNETHDRNELGPLAMKRAEELLPDEVILANDVVVIGDSLRDAACANALGAKCIITLTGKTTREEFLEYVPHYFFDDLTNIEAVKAAIFGEQLSEEELA